MLSAGPQVLLIIQGRTRLDWDRIEVVDPDVPWRRTEVGAGVGGVVDLGWQMPLGSRLVLLVSARGSLLALRVTDQGQTRWRAIPTAGVVLGLWYRY